MNTYFIILYQELQRKPNVHSWVAIYVTGQANYLELVT
jgi:hypothetical protein